VRLSEALELAADVREIRDCLRQVEIRAAGLDDGLDADLEIARVGLLSTADRLEFLILEGGLDADLDEAAA